jgi:hypothetical protein
MSKTRFSRMIMMDKFKKYFPFFLLLIVLLFTNQITLAYADEGLTLFQQEEVAQKHCPNDEVVWLNLPTGIWHTKYQRWYGRTKSGAYVCKQEAAAAGDRASLNG